MRESQLRFAVESDERASVVTADGTLSAGTSSALRSTLHKCLVDQPSAVILDLTRIEVAERGCLTVLSAVARQASIWPAVPFVVVESRRDVLTDLDRLGFSRAVPVRPTVAAALESIDQGEAQPTVREILPPIRGAARHARAVITESCLSWGFAGVVGPACAVATELISNATRHADTTMTLRLSHRGRWLLLAVEDGGAGLPERLPMPAHDDGGPGRGLGLVEALSHRWGWLSTDAGKVVWAVLRV
ncbi:ATP-binding protein [Asanoa sp. WMMD1127]|uniref:ATP-binding protein n=1 Tax=Asanoa sp. WMMD1127 TaxID=3016107 RepID=UPI0024172E3B|nr:STAS domain-containing protein [Asanoa sp. WMMD1127]MDG4825811.1 ATP-binding protein [Asanoa sp. WMMD1127]